MHSTDKLTIDTPEQIALELPLAGVGSRFLAFAVDSLIQFIASFVLVLIVMLVPGAAIWRGLSLLPEKWFVAIVILLMFCLYWGYFAVFEILWKGQTPGKRHAGIRVIKDSGRPLNAYEVVARNLMRAIDGLPGVYGVGVVTMMLNQAHRRLGDYVAGSVVVHEKGMAEVKPDFISAPAVANSAGVSLTTDELVLIETFLHRRLELSEEVRYRNADLIAMRLAARLKIARDPQQSPEDFLEKLAAEARSSARFRG